MSIARSNNPCLSDEYLNSLHAALNLSVYPLKCFL